MSIEVMTRVWKQSKQTEASRLLLLLALADHADPEGVCFPGVPHLARKIRKSERHARRLLRELENTGEVYTGTNRGPHLANLYYVTVGFTQEEIEATLTSRFRLSREDAKRIAVTLLAPDADVRGGPDAGVPSSLTPTSATPDADVSLIVINRQEPSEEPSLSACADLPDLSEEPKSYTPGPGKIVSCIDPDTDEVVGEPDWHFPQTQAQHQAFNITGRKRFRSRAEYNKMRRIETMLENGDLPTEFWEERKASAEKHNWSFPKLLEYTLNEDSLRDWEARQ